MENKIDFSKLEVLSPAGNAESFYAALNNGADAIYLGLSDFNARIKAENFTTENIREYVKSAHVFGVKVYVTINTLIQDEDFDKLIYMVKKLTEAKVDAFIVQDLGVAYALKTCFDNIVLHASTQMGVHNLDGAIVAEKLGFSRIVLSRETSLEDIKLISENTNLEIEYFVQGALCVAFSGNCYLSSLENGMSGNEGKCLQLCRLPYKNNLNGKESYYLSTRDLCLLENLEQLINAGVTSFKIEGRLRHAGYVATATNIYKQALEKIKNKSLEKSFINDSKNALKISFSRGEYNTNAYLHKTPNEEIIYSDFQNHIGKKIGEVVSVNNFKNTLYKIEIKSTHSINSGDGLKFINPKTKEQISSMGVGNIEKLTNGNLIIYSKNKVFAGLSVHLTQNSFCEESLLKKRKKIPLNVKIIANFNKKMQITAENQHNKICFESDEILEKATKSPVDYDEFFAQFSKLNDTNFSLQNLDVETNGIFAPKSLLNAIRRKMIELIETEIIEHNEKYLTAKFNNETFYSLKNKKIITNPTNILIVDDENFNVEDNTIYVYSPTDFSDEIATKILQKVKPENFALEMPVILKQDDKILFEKILKKLPNGIHIYVNNIGGFNYQSKGYKIITSPLCNIKNTFAIKYLNSLNIEIICESIESNTNFAFKNELIKFKSGLFPVMTFAHCPYKVVNNLNCNKCTFNDNLIYSKNNSDYKVKRKKLSNCYFELCTKIYNENITFGITNLKH